jgi:hypothetical protein
MLSKRKIEECKMAEPPPPAATPALELAREYIRLGGKRRSANDDNKVSTREWEPDSPEAKSFWRNRIETLPEEKRNEVISHLPTISVI